MDRPTMSPDLQRVLAPDYLAGIADADAPTLRAMREECDTHEQRVSYARRILQGRMDILRAEARERDGDTGSAVLGQLADSLSDQGVRHFDPARSRPPTPLDPSVLEEELDEVGPADVSSMSSDELEQLAASYVDRERDLSQIRRQLFDVIDRLQAEIADRYRQGLTSVADLLNGV